MKDIVKQLEEALDERVSEEMVEVDLQAGDIETVDWWREKLGGKREPFLPSVRSYQTVRINVTDHDGNPINLYGATSVAGRLRKVSSRIAGMEIDKQIIGRFADRDKGIVEFDIPPGFEAGDLSVSITAANRTYDLERAPL
jgi:hypothetical protein